MSRGSHRNPFWRFNVSDADDFRKQAEEARQTAARSQKQDDKAFWLRLAEDWMALAQEADEMSRRPALLPRQDAANSN
jgi:anaerobic glycerol-3-phosphate dehydrogenase